MVVLITGRIRSGTSCVAQVVHRLGVPVAVQMHAPIPPTYRMDWEDCELSGYLNSLLIGDPLYDPPGWLAGHFITRARMAQGMFGSERFAAKSPFLSLTWAQAVWAAERFGPVVTITTERQDSDVAASVERAFPRSMVARAHAANVSIGEAARSIKATLSVPYESLVRAPTAWASTICEAIDGDKTKVAAAAACILEPT